MSRPLIVKNSHIPIWVAGRVRSGFSAQGTRSARCLNILKVRLSCFLRAGRRPFPVCFLTAASALGRKVQGKTGSKHARNSRLPRHRGNLPPPSPTEPNLAVEQILLLRCSASLELNALRYFQSMQPPPERRQGCNWLCTPSD